MVTTRTRTRSKGKDTPQEATTPQGEEATQEEATQEEATPNKEEATTPQDQDQANKEATTQEATQEKDTTPKLGGTGVWDALGFWVVVQLLKGDPTLQEKGVTATQVGEHILSLKVDTPTFLELDSLGAFPQGVTLAHLHSIPLKGEGGWVRKLDNTLWRCSQKGATKQDGGGKYSPSLLIRHSTTRPVTFTLVEPLPQEEATS